MDQKPLRVAVLDMYDNTPNQGMRCIQEIISRYHEHLSFEVFDVRGKADLPSTEYDIYISTGGPGSPVVGHPENAEWEKDYFALLEDLWQWNQKAQKPPKYVFFICHSFQLACQHFKVAKVTERNSMSFGIFPIHKTPSGTHEILFAGLNDPFYAADFRSYQAVQPDYKRLEELGAEILALEKIRESVPLERALMAIRFSEYFFAVQFHPEADPTGMREHFTDEERMEQVIAEHGADKYYNMVAHLEDPDRLSMTFYTVLPRFLQMAIRDEDFIGPQASSLFQ